MGLYILKERLDFALKQLFSLLFLGLCALYGNFNNQSYLGLNGQDTKSEFSKILTPLIEHSNEKILQERAFVLEYIDDLWDSFFTIANLDFHLNFIQIIEKYKIKFILKKSAFEEKIDIIPLSLALAQAAIESAWGKSRFAREGNNIFGHWTWGENGIIPLKRSSGARHKLRIFNSLQESVDEYALNLNTHLAYKDFRQKRRKFHKNGENFTGLEAAKTMIKYSQTREIYVEKLENLITSNEFLDIDYIKMRK